MTSRSMPDAWPTVVLLTSVHQDLRIEIYKWPWSLMYGCWWQTSRMAVGGNAWLLVANFHTVFARL
eukprot:11266019-Karenia_brevis.AAC.1